MRRFALAAKCVLPLLCLLLASCAEDIPEPVTTPPPEVVSVNVQEGDKVAANWSIIVTFNILMETVEISVSGAVGTTSLGPIGKKATWTPRGNIPPGTHTLTITGANIFDQELEGFTPINFTALAAPPPAKIHDAKCDPKNGATGVKPLLYKKLTIVFTEPMAEVKVTAVEPPISEARVTDIEAGLRFTSELSRDGMILTLKFPDGYRMPYNTKFKIGLSGKDKAGNELRFYYSFTTAAIEIIPVFPAGEDNPSWSPFLRAVSAPKPLSIR